MTKHKVLFLFKLPPPVNGATSANNYLYRSEILKKQFNCRYIHTGLANKSDDFGTVRPGKIWQYVKTLLTVTGTLATKKTDLVYITIAPAGTAFIKDSVFVVLAKVFRKNIVIHLHGKGINKKAASLKNLKKYYRFVFRNTTVICMSKKLTKDIETVYKGYPSIVPYGVPVVNYNLIKELTPEEPVVLYLSNLYIRKGVLDFVSSIEELRKINSNFES